MPETYQVAPNIRGLQGFARVLSSSQRSGDAHIIALLETGEARKGALCRQFLKFWNASETSTFHNLDAGVAGVLRKLQALTPKSRQAFLLRSLGQFDPWEIAMILGCSSIEAVRLIAAAGSEIASQLDPAEVLIIEDEALIMLHLEELVGSLGHTVVGLASTCKQAVAMAECRPPRLILADIQLSDDSSGLGAVNEILSHFEVPVIFITGHAELLLTGTKPGPTFVIPKPFDGEAVKAVISQALFFDVCSRLGAAGLQGPAASGA